MSFYTMAKALTLEVPAVTLSLAKNKVAEALGKIEDENDWSFQTQYAGWLAPGQLANTGTFTVTPYQNTVTADATATAAVLAIQGNPLITTLQYRDPARSIYSIVGLAAAGTVAYLTIASPGSGQTPGMYVVNGVGDGTGAQAQIVVNSLGTVTAPPVILNPGSGYTACSFTLAAGGTPATFATIFNAVLTLDRPWMEPTSGPGQPYMIYQAYFVVNVPAGAFRKFIEIRDTTNARALDFWSYSQADLAVADPQRTDFSDPNYVVPAGIDLRPGSATYGYPLFELAPQQLSLVPYSFSFRWRGPTLVNPSDTIPYPLTEELVMHRAKELLCFYKEMQKGEDIQRGSGANWLLLAKGWHDEYEEVLNKIRAIDINLHNEAVTHRVSTYGASGYPYANRQGGVNVGSFPEGR